MRYQLNKPINGVIEIRIILMRMILQENVFLVLKKFYRTKIIKLPKTPKETRSKREE
jgi:hypothetical protein